MHTRQTEESTQRRAAHLFGSESFPRSNFMFGILDGWHVLWFVGAVGAVGTVRTVRTVGMRNKSTTGTRDQMIVARFIIFYLLTYPST